MKNIFCICFIVTLLLSCEKNVIEPNKTENLERDTWTVIYDFESEQTYFKIYFIDSRTGFVIGIDGLIKKTTDGGLTWKDIKNPSNGWLSSICFINKKRGFIAGTENTFLVTDDAGDTWRQQNVHNNSSAVNGDISFIDKNRGYCITNHGDVFSTNNSGRTWVAKSKLPDMGWTYIKMFSGSVGYASRYFGPVIYRTTDGAQTWENMNVTVPDQILNIMISSIFFVSKDIGYFSYEWSSSFIKVKAAPIMRTEDQGETWTFQDSIKLPCRCVHFIDESKGWAGGHAFFYTEDEGKNWKMYNKNIWDMIEDIYFIDERQGWALSRYGKIHRYIK